MVAKTDTTAQAAPEAKGSAWLAEQVNKAAGTDIAAYDVRITLRKLTKDGVIEREEGRYTFTGLKDPRVVEVIKYYKSGKAEADKKAKLDAAKARSAAKAPAAKKAAPAKKATASRAKAKPAPEPVTDEDDDLDIDEI